MMARLMDLTKDEKGLVARALLMCFLKNGHCATQGSSGDDVELTVKLKRWQLMLLSRVSE